MSSMLSCFWQRMCLACPQEHDYCSAPQWSQCPEPEIGTRGFFHSGFQVRWTTPGKQKPTHRLLRWSQGRGLWNSHAEDSSWKRKACFHNSLCFINACHLTEENLLTSSFFFRLWPLTYFEWFTPAIHCPGMLALAKNRKSLKINTTGLSSRRDSCWLNISNTVQQDMLN